MPSFQKYIYLAETTVNTINYENTALPVPDSAKQVVLDLMAIDAKTPEAVASGYSSVIAGLLTEKRIPANSAMGQAGHTGVQAEANAYYAASALVTTSGEKPKAVPGPIEVLKDPSDGKFYITPFVKGVAQTNPTHAYFVVRGRYL